MKDTDLLKLLNDCEYYMHYRRPAHRGRLTVLHSLDEEGPLTQSGLIRKMDVKAGSMSELLRKMEEDGLIQRKRGEKDKRQVYVLLGKLLNDWKDKWEVEA